MSNLLKKDKGFTLIEIVLVLAIAGLLLVIVFLAVSGAQKSRRDSQRKTDNSRLLAQLESYASNNAGAYPLTGAAFDAAFVTSGGTYTPSNFKDPTTGSQYTYSAAALSTTSAAGAIHYTLGGGAATACDGTAMAGTRNVKVEMKLEQGVACVDNK